MGVKRFTRNMEMIAPEVEIWLFDANMNRRYRLANKELQRQGVLVVCARI